VVTTFLIIAAVAIATVAEEEEDREITVEEEKERKYKNELCRKVLSVKLSKHILCVQKTFVSKILFRFFVFSKILFRKSHSLNFRKFILESYRTLCSEKISYKEDKMVIFNV